MKNSNSEYHDSSRVENEVVDYYNQCTTDYRLVWHLDTEMGMHYGYWDNSTPNLRTAIRNMNSKLANFGNIKQGSKILDAGCGAGGSSIFLATNYDAQVTGIALPPYQIEQCKLNAAKFGLENKTIFEVQNYCHTSFDNQAYDYVWAIESICHAQDKTQFIAEAFRLLKPGGMLLMADFFSTQQASSWLQKMENSWSIPRFESVDFFETNLRNVGFVDIKTADVSKQIYPSVKRLYACYFPGIVISKTMECLRLRTARQTENTRSCLYQYKAYHAGDWRYAFIRARKPDA